MWKEIIISTAIVLLVIIGNNVTQGYIVDSAEEMTGKLKELESELKKEEENANKQKIDEMIKGIQSTWDERHEKFAYFIEHDELEKAETSIISMKSFIETKEYPEAISELDQSIFILQHIEEKYAFSLENIF